MILHTRFFTSFIVITTSVLGIISCTPSFETTAEKCVTYSPVTLGKTKTNDNTEFQVLANRTNNDYQLYLEDALNSLNNAQSKASDGTTSALSADEQAAIQYMYDVALEKMGYVVEFGEVVSASNPLDYLESLLVATDPDEVIKAFEDAKQNIGAAIKSNNDYCNYRNPAITLFVEDPDIPSSENNVIETIRAQLNLFFNPFDDLRPKDISQDFIIGTDEPLSEQNIIERQANNFAGSTRFTSDDYKLTGSSPMLARVVSQNNSETNQTFEYTDVFLDSKLGTFRIEKLNEACLLKDEDGKIIIDNSGRTTVVTCPEGTETRTPQHDSCKGGVDVEGNALPDDTDTIQVNNFTVVPGNDLLTDVQRLRVEIDFLNNEILFYASKYELAILRAAVADPNNPVPETDIIYNPTTCEVNAVEKEMRAMLPIEEQETATVNAIEVLDPYYDRTFTTDDNGNEVDDFVPTPIFRLEGTAITARQ